MMALLDQPEPERRNLDWDGWQADSNLEIQDLSFAYPVRDEVESAGVGEGAGVSRDAAGRAIAAAQGTAGDADAVPAVGGTHAADEPQVSGGPQQSTDGHSLVTEASGERGQDVGAQADVHPGNDQKPVTGKTGRAADTGMTGHESAQETIADKVIAATGGKAAEQQAQAAPTPVIFSDRDGAQAAAPIQTGALEGLNLSLHGYTKLAVIGRSGAGKSTLVNLLAGFNIPQSGSIRLDGKRLESFNAQAWQEHISYIPQAPYIFNGSIADNIRFYVQNADDQAVMQAADQAGLGDWLASLSEGLETHIGEGNRGISGGQAQRIALARVILDKSRRILLFDEPTAHLDIETEYELKQTLLPIMEDHLVIFATHRLHWLADVDQVIMLDRGRIVAQGKPSELIGQGGPLDQLIDEMGGNQIDGYRNI
ncbi:hypothetical protein CRD60_06580 [Bifidobacterium aemilianum]|uniref:ABC transporter domain-containing protein n=2 Tax=Bifidobacterium aemilianum TaxID=2493120 RepID=A0A366K8B7_9BIFI|nr:hypothetical protein CRD60_06580 [Bifidobacterium aemilianum]